MVTRELDRALRAGKRLSLRHLRHVVDQGGGTHLALVVPGEDGHHGQSKKLFFSLRKVQRCAACRVLIDSDLWSEPPRDDPCTALCDRAPKPRAADGKLSEVS
jgi:hypothetical protein